MITMNRQQAVDAAAKAGAERDTIQANLLDLDGSFGKRLLAGAQLTGVSKDRWDKASATLAALWDTYATYSGVVDRVVALAAGRLGQKELTELTSLLTLPSVQVTRAQTPLSRRDLADTGRDTLTLATAVARMRDAFAEVTGVVTAAEQAWNTIAAPLDAAAADLARAGMLAGSDDEGLAAEFAQLRTELDARRAALNADPLGAQVAAANRLNDRAAAARARAEELASLRTGAARRVAAVRGLADEARAARADAMTAYERVVIRVAGVPPVPDFTADPATRLARLDALLQGGRWTRLGSELDLLERELAAETAKFQESERTVVTLLGRRDELRGLLDAYKAKAARLGAAEDGRLADLYEQARGMLWTAPCDLAAAAAAVKNYQQAVLAIGARRL